jgi:2-amino-4-hydroxy-6-hydroxymethyldihydropteridine diphosphokinase
MPAEKAAPSEARIGASGAVVAILGIGSNVGDGIRNIEEAISRLTADTELELVARSKLYRTAPWGVTDQAAFVNACISVRTSLKPRHLLEHCLGVENAMGRVRTLRWGPRIIDVDILTYDALAVDEPDLVIPHPRITERAFVLIPMKDVAPDLRIEGEKIETLLERLDSADVQPLTP